MRRLNPRRRGFILQETLMAILVVMAVTTAACQLLYLIGNQRRTSGYRTIAEFETANAMELVLSRNWTELSPGSLELQMSRYCQEQLPDPELRIDVVSDDANAGSRRIEVELDWAISDDQRSKPARLVAWRYPPGEVQP